MLVGGDAGPEPLTAATAGACLPFALGEQLDVARAAPPSTVALAAPALASALAPAARASGHPGDDRQSADAPRAARASDRFCPAPLDVGASFDPRLAARVGSAGGGDAGIYLSALRGPARSGVAPASGVDMDDRSWKVCLSLAEAPAPIRSRSPASEPDRVLAHGLVLRRQQRDGRTRYVFYVATAPTALRLRFADGRSDEIPVRDGVATLLQRGTAASASHTPSSYEPLRDGDPLPGGSQIDYMR